MQTKVVKPSEPFGTHTLQESITYEGIQRFVEVSPDTFQEEDVRLIIVKADGEVSEVWVVKGEEGMDTLRLYYATERDVGCEFFRFKADNFARTGHNASW